jgi:hypothetical protein
MRKIYVFIVEKLVIFQDFVETKEALKLKNKAK